ncbi:hypothetical protein METBIDRAFT_38081 [Metschnikowia bicuspidata var. bicuspidata NRRL YB-4993]|uniref:RAVE complex protein Rav1 C-terminal domain-containing protein n=1 Tax=Metschnikowia bicuspidata var. bicuspidata NRRL YB-4993 TaxID=869754 RepID=A0A1A0HF27_9ASCO|nr:hypothetical protein METBIDRAFT_38081 [Metschnikowia bicuspidata var. bicuspidata NRRL YB-4993]OBA22734.1 hypothetical protein METBIDRAFT_38081 [Metschnikowia bicuspidata var. bicuspidata NRRL YB-4993]
MTLHFTPGDANGALSSHHQAQWRNHHIVAYGLGNNLILHSVTDGLRRSLQTIYLAGDLTSVAINEHTGLIALSCGTTVCIFRPVNEYMSVPKWTEALRFSPDSTQVNCVKWVPQENELAVGSDALWLYHVVLECGTVSKTLRWTRSQAAPVEMLDITADGSKLVSYTSSRFDSFAKVWMRLSYGNTTSLFDLVYADHKAEQYLCFLQWRVRPVAVKLDLHSSALALMLHIKNIRSFMPNLILEDNDILYTVTNDKMLHVWATCEFNGHSYLKLWSQYDLTTALGDDFMSFLLINGAHAQNIYAFVKSQIESKKSGNALDCEASGADFLILIGSKNSLLVQISNVTCNPPNSIKYDAICIFPTSQICVPRYNLQDVVVDELSVDKFLTGMLPVACTNTISLLDSLSTISFLIHDRVKSTLRAVELKLGVHPELQLKEKFQGHGKSVKKLYASSSSHEGNIMLSLLNFPDHNYIWEPFALENSGNSSMAITKRFCLNVTRDPNGNIHEQGIENAILLNDIYPPHDSCRHHLAVVFEKGGFLSLWDCDGETMDDKEVELVTRMETSGTHDSRYSSPKAFFLKSLSDVSYVIVAIYDPSTIEAWRIDVSQTANGDDGRFFCERVWADSLPGNHSELSRIATVETFLENDITIIDQNGLLRSIAPEYNSDKKIINWKETRLIHTNIEKASLVHGASLVSKIAIVNQKGNTLTIWDSKTGVLEYEENFPEEYGPVRDLDWTFLGSIGSTANTLLAVGFSRFVLLYTQLRYDYTNKVSTFAALKKIDISDYSSHEIGDLIWLDDSYLVISSGNQFFIDDKWVQFGQGTEALSNNSISSTISQLLLGYKSDQSRYPIADLVRILNGPLPVYHPQFLIQALLMGEVELVEAVMVKLLKTLRTDADIAWNLDIQMVDLMTVKETKNIKKRSLLDAKFSAHVDIFDSFNPNVADLLSEKLISISLPLLTRHQQTTLRNLVILLNKLAPLRNSLDSNGMKFMYGFELFKSSHKQKRLTMRDINWAVHSDQKEMLFSTIENHYHRLTWNSVKEVGLAYWVDVHRLRKTMESAARNEFADERDPSGIVSILYLAIKKKQILLGLWRTIFHPEKDKVVKFLSNNFSEPRWQSAALKNAFVLLGKHRYMDAAYFFLLANKVKDCCMTLCNKVQEFDLALAVARVNSDEDAVRTVLEHYILPEALETGDRWTTSWAFWEMKLKEISIQALVMSPIGVVRKNADHFSESFLKETEKLEIRTKSKSFLRVDPMLGVLYQTLRTSKLRYLEGSKDVLPEVEFEFVVRLSSLYSRMGCDYLSLSLLRNWKFLDYSQSSQSKEKDTITKGALTEFSSVTKQQKLVPEPSTFEEPDMSAFSFGF